MDGAGHNYDSQWSWRYTNIFKTAGNASHLDKIYIFSINVMFTRHFRLEKYCKEHLNSRCSVRRGTWPRITRADVPPKSSRFVRWGFYLHLPHAANQGFEDFNVIYASSSRLWNNVEKYCTARKATGDRLSTKLYGDTSELQTTL